MRGVPATPQAQAPAQVAAPAQKSGIK